MSASEIRARRLVADITATQVISLSQPTIPYEEEHDEGEALAGEEMAKYQSVAALLNYVSMDRPVVLYASKECMRRMTNPHRRQMEQLKRIVRYMKTAPRALMCWSAASIRAGMT